MARTIIIAAGGTGGHVFPAICLAEELEQRGFKVVFATDLRGLKYLGRFEQAAIVQNIGTSSRCGLYVGILISFFKSFFKIWKLKPVLVVGFGGYPSVPFLAAAQLMRIKTVIHEQNAIAGKANAFLSKLARLVFTSFPNTLGFDHVKNLACVGNPTRFEADYDKCSNEKNGAFTLLVFGGSQGAKIFSETVVDAICEFSKSTTVRIFQQGRESDVAVIQSKYTKAGITDVTVQPFFCNIDELYRQADIVISRSGASSVFEIIGFSKPSILVPYGRSINGDQLENAKFLEAWNAAIVIRESELSKESLLASLSYLASNPDYRAQMSRNLMELRIKDSVKKIADLIDEII